MMPPMRQWLLRKNAQNGVIDLTDDIVGGVYTITSAGDYNSYAVIVRKRQIELWLMEILFQSKATSTFILIT